MILPDQGRCDKAALIELFRRVTLASRSLQSYIIASTFIDRVHIVSIHCPSKSDTLHITTTFEPPCREPGRGFWIRLQFVRKLSLTRKHVTSGTVIMR